MAEYPSFVRFSLDLDPRREFFGIRLGHEVLGKSEPVEVNVVQVLFSPSEGIREGEVINLRQDVVLRDIEIGNN